LSARATSNLKTLGCENIHIKHADGYFGWPQHAPFDAVIITAAANHVPPPLIEQLKDGGKLIMPLAAPGGFQALTIITRTGDDIKSRVITGVRFVPMTGKTMSPARR